MPKIKLTGLDFSESLFVKRLSLGFALDLLGKAKGLITLPFYTRLLGADGLGVFSLILVTSNLLLPLFGNIGAGLGAYTAPLTDKEKIRRNYYSALYSSLFIAFLCAAVLLIMGMKLLPENISKYLWIVVLFAFTILGRSYAVIVPQMFQKTKVLATSTFLMDYGGAGLSIALVYLGYGPVGAVAGLGISNFIGAMILFYFIYENIGISFAVDLSIVKKFALFSIPLIPLSFSGWIIDGADKYFIYYFYETAQVGIYSVANSISSLVLMVSSALYFTFTFSILKLWDEDKERFYSFIRVVTKWTVIGLSILLSLLFIGNHILVYILAGPGFNAAEKVIPILGLGFCASVMSVIFTSMFYAIKKSRVVMYAFLFAAILNVLLNILLIPPYNILGAAVATTISYVSLTTLLILMTRRYFELYLNYALYAKILASSLLIAILILWAKKVMVINIFAAAALAVATLILYASLLLILKCITISEIKQILYTWAA